MGVIRRLSWAHSRQGVVSKRGHFNKNFRKRLFELKNGVLSYYKVEDLVIDDRLYCTNSSPVRGMISCQGLKVEALESVRHKFSDNKADRHGFQFLITGCSRTHHSPHPAHHTTYVPHPTPYDLHPTPTTYTLHSKTCTFRPIPYAQKEL